MTPLRSTLPRSARPTTSTRPRDVSTLDDTGLVAACIVAAGKRRRAESSDDLPADPTARAIVLAGRKARGEVVDAD